MAVLSFSKALRPDIFSFHSFKAISEQVSWLLNIWYIVQGSLSSRLYVPNNDYLYLKAGKGSLEVRSHKFVLEIDSNIKIFGKV